MSFLALALIFLIALAHLYFCWIEMFAWVSRGPKIFTDLPKNMFEPTRPLAANQGLYNVFLAAGLFWALLLRNSDPDWAQCIAIFFLSCITVAGIYGGKTVNPRIFLVQTVPAVVAIGLIYLG